jgi:uncharacterized membrane protein YqaE (UPF0057 family)
MKKMKFLLIPFLAILILFSISAFASTVTGPTTGDPDAKLVKQALKEFRSLPRSERKARMKEAKKVWKQYQADVKAGKAQKGDSNVLAIIFAILIPFVGVLIYEGKVTNKFWIALLLTILFWLPGAIYALLVVTDNA